MLLECVFQYKLCKVQQAKTGWPLMGKNLFCQSLVTAARYERSKIASSGIGWHNPPGLPAVWQAGLRP